LQDSAIELDKPNCTSVQAKSSAVIEVSKKVSMVYHEGEEEEDAVMFN
jgi:hypothetical protein